MFALLVVLLGLLPAGTPVLCSLCCTCCGWFVGWNRPTAVHKVILGSIDVRCRVVHRIADRGWLHTHTTNQPTTKRPDNQTTIQSNKQTNRADLSQFYHELGVQILDVCYGTRARNGGIIAMVR